MSELSNKAVATVAVMALCLTACAGMCMITDDSDAASEYSLAWNVGKSVNSVSLGVYPGDCNNLTYEGSVPGISIYPIQNGQMGVMVANGTPTTAGTYVVKVFLSGSLLYTNNIVVTSNSSSVNVAWLTGTALSNSTVTQFPGTASSVSITGSVPGVTITAQQNQQNVVIVANGTPTTAGTYTVNISSSGSPVSCTVTVTNPTTSSTQYDYKDATVGQAFNYVGLGLELQSGSIPGCTVENTVQAGNLFLRIYGTPTTAGTYTVQAKFIVNMTYNGSSILAGTIINIVVTVSEGATYLHTVHYDANGGSGAPSDQSVSDSVSGNTAVTVSSDVPSRSGYNFLGWSTSSTATSATVFAGDSVSVAGGSTTTLYAVWKQITYNHEVIFNLNGGQGAAVNLSATNGNSNHIFTIPTYSITKPYCEFKGWSYTQGGSVEVSPGQTVTVSPNASVTLYAVWEAVPVNITSTNPVEFLVTGNSYQYDIATDVDGATLSFSGPSWMSLNGSTLVGTPVTKGTYNVTITATYGNMTDTQSFNVTVENRLSFESVPTGGILATPVI